MTTRADSIAFYHSGKLDETDGKRVCDGSPESMHGAAGAPPQLTDGACVAAQSIDVAALRHTLQARPLALRLHRERAIGAKSTDLCAVDFHVGRAQRADNRGSRMLSRTQAHRARPRRRSTGSRCNEWAWAEWARRGPLELMCFWTGRSWRERRRPSAI